MCGVTKLTKMRVLYLQPTVLLKRGLSAPMDPVSLKPALPISPSITFRDSLSEALTLMQIHATLTGDGPGRRRNVEVLSKSAILLICASFEAFVETLASEAFLHLVSDAKSAHDLPKPIRKAIAESVKKDKNELKVWDLAGDGWRVVGAEYRSSVIKSYTGPFNTPKPHNIKELMRELVGFDDMPSHWKWKGMTSNNACENLKAFVELRGALAHGAKPAPTVTKAHVTRCIHFLAPLSVRSSNVLRHFCHEATGKYPWATAHYNSVV